MKFEFRHVNYYLVCTTLFGLGLFYWAPVLCRSTTVHYTTVISLGASLSLLLLVYFAQSRVRNTVGIGGLFFTYMGSLYGVTSGWYNLPSLLRYREELYANLYFCSSKHMSIDTTDLKVD